MTSNRILVRLVRNWLTALVDPHRFLGITSLPRYFGEWRSFNRLAGQKTLRWHESYPCLADRIPHTPFDPHYFYQACWAAHKIAASKPSRHLDVGSNVAMVGILSALVPTIFIDFRPLLVKVPGLTTMAGNLLALPIQSGSIHSFSCLHVIEHVGLGRYGDFLDPQGSIKASRECQRVLAPGGRLLLSTPVGRERIEFNAHRVFAPVTVVSMFDKLELVDFAMVDDEGEFFAHSNPKQASSCEYACGMFDFIKRK